ncbi:MAG TPA: neutral/alkaline non-lysosomal ceramidase N-terminal domain-containing protein [Ktedonobacterales bacterium]|nr:neutral/alkaline non-lysosomal ceramidase N-terminal domain-containing protein [Ktedonobacterales bacterium]
MRTVVSGCLLIVLLCCSTSVLVMQGGQETSSACSPAANSDLVLAGAARADISPQQPVYLGGYGFGPARLSTGVMQPLFVRALALRSMDNRPEHTLIFAALDSQGYFAAYQSGPYGIADMRAALNARLGIPVSNIIIASTHSHAAPDTVGFWGGVPDSYLARVHDQTIRAVTQAVANLAPARLSAGTASIDGYTTSFGDDERGSQGSAASWPADTQLRLLRAVSSDGGQTIATLVNISVHPTALGSSNTLASPDWPGVTTSDLETQLGGIAVLMIGALGHTWPGVPSGATSLSKDAEGMRQYGDLMARRALEAANAARPVTNPTLCAADQYFREADTTAPLLLGLQFLGRSGHERILRSLQEPYFAPPNGLGVEVETLRIGNLVFLTAPVEPYPSLLFALRQQIQTPMIFFFGLANDQLGYATEPGEYPGAVVNSPTDEALFILSPTFGNDIINHLLDGARQIGLATH